MRQQLDIYASVVLCKSLPGFPTRHNNVDFAIIRENTEGEYSGLEHQSYPGVVESLKVSTRAKAERIARFAFDFALKNGRKVRYFYRSCNVVIGRLTGCPVVILVYRKSRAFTRRTS